RLGSVLSGPRAGKRRERDGNAEEKRRRLCHASIGRHAARRFLVGHERKHYLARTQGAANAVPVTKGRRTPFPSPRGGACRPRSRTYTRMSGCCAEEGFCADWGRIE